MTLSVHMHMPSAPPILLIAYLLVIATPARGQSRYALPSPLGVEQVIRAARDHRPEVISARSRARAAAQRPRIVSTLPDPMLMASVDHLPFSMMGADLSLALEQQFPFSSVLSRRGRAAEAGARKEAFDAARVTLDVALDATNAYFMLSERRRMLEVFREIDSSTRQLSAVASAQYSAARGAQADALRAESEVLRVESEIEALKSEVRAAEAMMNAAIGREAQLAVPELARAPVDRNTPPLARSVDKALARRPELGAMRQEQAQARGEVDVMKSMYAPMGFVRAGPSYTMAEGAGVMMMVGVSLPIWRDRINAGVDEANAMVQMATAEIAAMRNMIRGEVAVALAEVEAARVRLRALKERIVPKARLTVDSALAGYGAAQTSAVAVVEALRALFEVRAQEVMTESQLGLAWARFDRAVGEFGPVTRRQP